MKMSFRRRAKGGGRKPRGTTAGVSHLTRPRWRSRLPVHVTLRVRPHVYNLRSKRCFGPIRKAFLHASRYAGFRLNEFSVLGNHLHLIVEADGATQLARGMQGLEIRIAKSLNRLMQRRGRVFADRYHARVLRTPTEARHAVRYVRDNYRRHAQQHGHLVPRDYRDDYSSTVADAPPRTRLLRAAKDDS